MNGAESVRSFEERLGRHGKEFRGIRCPIGIQDGGTPGFIGGPQRFELPAHHARPRRILGPRRERWRSVRGVVLEVELVRKLVQHEIPAVRRIHRSSLRRVPGENNRSQPVLRVAEQVLPALFPDWPLKMPLSMRDVGRWINKDCAQFRVIVCLSMKEEKTRVSSNCETDFVRKLESAAALELLLS